LEAGQFLRISDIGDQTLAWTRPNFLTLRYELLAGENVVEVLRVEGIGPGRRVLAETGTSSWRFDLFPMDRPVVPVFRDDESEPVAEYDRRQNMQLRLVNGAQYELTPESPLKMTLADAEHRPVFSLEQVDAFPRWRVEIKLQPAAERMPDLPMLLAAACCSLVFPSYRTAKLTEPELAVAPTMIATG